MLTKRQRNSKLYKFVDSVLDDCATGAREEVLNFAQLQDEFHKISGRWIDPWQINEIAEDIIQMERPLLDFKIV